MAVARAIFFGFGKRAEMTDFPFPFFFFLSHSLFCVKVFVLIIINSAKKRDMICTGYVIEMRFQEFQAFFRALRLCPERTTTQQRWLVKMSWRNSRNASNLIPTTFGCAGKFLGGRKTAVFSEQVQI